MTRELALEEVFGPLTGGDLVRAVGKRGGDRLTFRPIELKGERKIQVATFDGRKTETKNYSVSEFSAFAREFLGSDFGSLMVTTLGEELSLAFSRKGRPLLVRRKVVAKVAPDLSHDRAVARLLPEGTPDPFLIEIGLMTGEGKIKADKMRKFRQINEFLRLVSETAVLKSSDQPLLVVDFGCGQAYLTLALHYYLNEKLGKPTELVGVDRSQELVQLGENKAAGRGRIEFVASSIADFVAPRTPDIVVALHACDTATDDALAKAVSTGAESIFVAPCCHHHLQVQLASSVTVSEGVKPLLREPIMRERLGDLVTDTFRALLLRMSGYSVDVIEFTLPEHTPRNLMIRARRTGIPDKGAFEEYAALKGTFGVTPYLESLLWSLSWS